MFVTLARVISLMLHPFLVIPITMGLIMWKVDLAFATTGSWLLLSLGLIILPVFIALALGRISGKYPDWDVHNRRLRTDLYKLGGVSAGLLLVIVHVWPAPPIFRATALAGALSLLAAWQINRITKISLHTLIISAAATALILTGFPLFVDLVLIGLVLALGTARIIARAHSAAQVLLGLTIGVLTVSSTYWLYQLG